jgi:hypothetical protein
MAISGRSGLLAVEDDVWERESSSDGNVEGGVSGWE